MCVVMRCDMMCTIIHRHAPAIYSHTILAEEEHTKYTTIFPSRSHKNMRMETPKKHATQHNTKYETKQDKIQNKTKIKDQREEEEKQKQHQMKPNIHTME